MTGTSFLLTPQSGEKITINSLAIVCIVMFLVYFAWSIPFHSSSVPLLGKYIIQFGKLFYVKRFLEECGIFSLRINRLVGAPFL